MSELPRQVKREHAEGLYDRLVDLRATAAAARARSWQDVTTLRDFLDALTAADAECALYRTAYPPEDSGHA